MEDVEAASSDQLDAAVTSLGDDHNGEAATSADADPGGEAATSAGPDDGEAARGADAGPGGEAATSAGPDDGDEGTSRVASGSRPLDAAPDVEAAARSSRPSRLAHLEREGEAAADFLERLLDIADLDGDIDVDIDGDRAAVAIVDSDEGRVPRRLVGPDGRALEALQELTRLAVEKATGERSRLMLDVAEFRAQRRSALVDLARAAIAEVRESGEDKALENMTAFERKVVHDEVTAAGLVSSSEGIEPHRHIVIAPRSRD